MTDRELLEFAAKAIGRSSLVAYKKFGPNGETLHIMWDPLTDDGDAYRLESDLRFDVRWGMASVTVDNTTERYSHGDDVAAVKRRAIVKAAAAIGKDIT